MDVARVLVEEGHADVNMVDGLEETTLDRDVEKNSFSLGFHAWPTQIK